MGVVQIQQDTSSHKLHFMPLLLLFWQFYSYREVPCVLEDSCHYCEHWKTPGDGDKLVYICLSFCCASESEGGFLLTGSGWYRPCQNWLEAAGAGARAAEAWLCMAPGLTAGPLHTPVIWHTFTFYQEIQLCMTCLFVPNKPVFQSKLALLPTSLSSDLPQVDSC